MIRGRMRAGDDNAYRIEAGRVGITRAETAGNDPFGAFVE